ncbi:MAG: MATE family efflux transporter [Oscillospiraceae bacterium]|nr:MATE family efflux transporter [Oscillospiraceae bacterium]
MNIQLSDHFDIKKLLRFTLPSIAMMIFTSIYGVVDGFFVSNYVGKIPFAAVNLIMPFLMILGTVGFMFGTGGSAIVAKTMGEGNKEKANSYFSLFIYFSVAVSVILAILGIIFLEPVSILLGAEGEMIDNCVRYGRIILLALPLFVLQLEFQSFFITAEKPNLGFISTVAAGVANMVLDALLVAVIPFGLEGAAAATAISQAVGGIIPLIYFSRKNSSLLRLGRTTFSGSAIGKACVNGSSEFMSNISMSLVGMLYNIQLLAYAGENGVAAYGVMMYVNFIFASAFIGYSIGVAPVVGFHDGAGNHDELKGLLRRSIRIVAVFSVCMTIAAQLLAVPLSELFVGYDKELMDLTVNGFRICGFCYLFMGFAIFSSGFFTALNDGVTSAIISFLRTLVFQCAAVMLLPLLWDINGVWLSIVVAEFMAVVLSVIFLIIKRKKYHY